MKRFFTLSLLFCIGMSIFAQESSRKSDLTAGVQILRSDFSQLVLEVNAELPVFQELKTPGGSFNAPVCGSMTLQGHAGHPALPVLRKLIQVPEGANVQVEIIGTTHSDYSLTDLCSNTYPLMPYQPDMLKSMTERPFYYNQSAYSSSAFIAPEMASVSVKGKMRHMRLATLTIAPYDYRASDKVLRVYHSMRIRIVFSGSDESATRQLSSSYNNPFFSSANSLVLNQGLVSNDRDTITSYPVKYVIVADTMFHDQLQPFVQWKTKKGFIVDEAYTSNSAVGTTTTSISAYLQGLYDNATPADPAPTFILIVGDVAQVPAFNGTTSSHVTDLYYAEFTGDMIADAYFGRFSASNTDQLQPQLDKTLEYEQYLFPQETWLDTVVMIAGVDASWSPTHANGQINYGNTYYFNAGNDIVSLTHLYPNSGSEDAQIRTEIGRGVSFANYTAHGYEDGWGDPSFDKTDIPAMNNAHQYPLMIGNACLTNSFQQPECFGEALLRANLKGAIGYIGGSNSTYWNEDFYWAVGVRSTVTANPVYDASNLGAYDRLWHITGEPFSEWYVSQGQMIMAGNLAVLEGGSSFDYYSEIYHLMGDPSLMIYLSVPTQLSVTHPALVPLGQSTISVTTEPYAYVGISQNGVWHGAGIADATGNLTINIIPFTVPGVADIVGTKQFRKPYVSTFIVQSPTGPYVLYNGKIIDDAAGNANQEADFMESLSLNVNLKNYGLQNDSTVYAILSVTDPRIHITDSIGIWGLIHSMDTLTLPAAFSLSIDTLVTDQMSVPLNLTVRDSSGNAWPSTFQLKINAPAPEILSMTVNDVAGGNGNGKLDPGETANLIISVVNNGHADVWNAAAVLSCSSPYITINSSNWSHDSLFVGIAENGVYQISVDAMTPIGTLVSFSLELEAMQYTANKIFSKSVGLIDEDWETGDMTQFAWTSSGNAPWIITSGNPYDGAFAAVSGDINDNEISTLSISINVLSADTLSFYKKVSCEEGWSGTLWDYLDFSIDGSSQGQWGGEIDWSKESFVLNTGQQTLVWNYVKDGSISSGSDASWVDNIVFPPMQVTTGLNDNSDLIQSIAVYPNPASSDLITLKASVSAGEVTMKVYSSEGRLMNSESFEVSDGIIFLPIDIKTYASGVYTIVLQSSNGYICSPFVKINQ